MLSRLRSSGYRTLVVLLILLTMSTTLGAGPAVSAAAIDFGPAPSELVTVQYLDTSPYYEWSGSDRAHLRAVWAGAPANPFDPAATGALVDLTEGLLGEAGLLQTAIDQLRSREGYLAERGYALYRAETTGKLMTLELALDARMKLVRYLVGEDTARPGADFYPAPDREGDFQFDLASRSNQGLYPDAGRVAEALDYLPVDPASFDGYEAYLLPYAISEAAGYGGLWHASIGAHTAGTGNTDQDTTAHEFAHHFSSMYLSDSYEARRELWDEYIAVRGLPGYGKDGLPATKDWNFSTKEVFAEDFRVLVGDPVAAAKPPQTAYGDPRSLPGLADKLRAFFSKIATAHEPPVPPTELAVGILGGTTVIPRGLSYWEPETTYVITDQTVLPFIIASKRSDVSFWLSKGADEIQNGWSRPLTNDLYFGELRLTAGPGLYKLVLNADRGAELQYRAVYIVARGGPFAEPRATAAAKGTPAPAVAMGTQLAWVSDSRIVVTGDLTGYKIDWDYLIDPNRKNYTRVNLRAAALAGGPLGAYGLNLEGGDGTYRIYYEPASGAITPTTVVVDQPGDPWSPTYVPAGRAVTADMVAVVTDSSSLTMTGYSSDPYIGLFVNDPSGKQLGYAPAKRASDGSFRGTVDLPVEAGFPSGQGLYSVLVATGQLSDTTLMTKWTIPVKLAAGAGAGAATATGGSSATSPSLASLNLADAERALSAGDDYLAGTTYLMALRSATQTGDSATLQRSVQGLLGLAEGARSYLLTDSAAGSLDRGADPLVHTGFAYARAYRRHEALKAFTEVLVADPANAVAADGLKLVSDPAYALSQPSSSPPIYLTKLPDIDIWAKAIIERMNFKGIIRGFADGTFAPDRQVRRDEAVAMVDRVLGFEDEAKVKAQTAGAADVPYADFSSIADWARGYVAAAYAHGLVNLREARFRPSDRATRAEVAVMLVRGLGAEAEQSARGMAGEKTAFADDARIPAWARGYLVYALKNGILTGYGDNTMRPNDPVRRSEMAALAGRIDDRTRTAIDRSELEGTLTKVEAGEPGTIYVLEDGAPSGAGGAAKGLALNPSLYAAGKAIFVLDLKPGSRVRVVTGEGGIVSYVEVLATPSAPKAPGL